MSGTYLNIDDAQFVVDQQQIVVTQAIGISRFVHPAAEDRQYKATFYAHKNSGFVVIEELVEQVSLLMSFYYSQFFSCWLKTEPL
jgi:hypothetical protein